MGLAVVSEAATPDIRQVLDKLQFEQFQHDETYHREIARLTVQDRLKHMALHFAKYAGALAEGSADERRVQRIVTDVFIIATSCANILNVRLSALTSRGESAPTDGDVDAFTTTVMIQAGRMAAACEKLDHLEDFPFRPTIRDASIALLDRAIRFAGARNWELQALVCERLAGVKEKMIFHGQV